MTEHTQPGRRGLILGAAVVALYGKCQEYALQARFDGRADPMQNHVYAEVHRVMTALRANQPVQSNFEVIVDLMALTRQTLRVSYEEWSECVPFTTTLQH